MTVFCQLPTGLTVQGPAAVLVNQPATYLGLVQPITTSRPLTLTWSNEATGPQVLYSWPATGTYTLTVTATNACGQAQARQVVRVLAEWPYHRALPVILRH